MVVVADSPNLGEAMCALPGGWMTALVEDVGLQPDS